MFSPCFIKHAFTVLQGNHHGWWSWNRCFIFFLGKNLNCHQKDKIPTDASSFDLIMSKKDQSIYVKMWKMFCTILSNVVLLNLESFKLNRFQSWSQFVSSCVMNIIGEFEYKLKKKRKISFVCYGLLCLLLVSYGWIRFRF